MLVSQQNQALEELYDDTDFRKVDRIEGQVLRYGLLAILLRVGDLMDLEEGRICEFNMHLNTNEFDYVREVIQNAIDATLLKIYLDDEEDIKYKSPRSWKCNDKVIVAYSQKQGVLWIEDYGIGMSEGELSKYLFKTANSGYKYMKKREFVFPAIAQFGIGFVACLTKAEKSRFGF